MCLLFTQKIESMCVEMDTSQCKHFWSKKIVQGCSVKVVFQLKELHHHQRALSPTEASAATARRASGLTGKPREGPSANLFGFIWIYFIHFYSSDLFWLPANPQRASGLTGKPQEGTCGFLFWFISWNFIHLIYFGCLQPLHANRHPTMEVQETIWKLIWNYFDLFRLIELCIFRFI